MKRTAVIGLGIIGGSICASLSKAGYAVDGMDIDEKTLAYALDKGYIQGAAKEISAYDTVFLALPPQTAIDILQNAAFKARALVSDICGVKAEIERAVYAKPRTYRYIGIHPMAGKETSGIFSASSELFHMANLVVTLCDKTSESALREIKEYAKAMRFGKIVECSALEHDEKIALTSQLAHLVSNAYVKSPQVKNCDGFTGGSFQDMTRIAGVDEKIWSQLYLFNKEPVLEELTRLISHLEEYKRALEQEDGEALSAALKVGRLLRENIKYRRDT